MADPPVDPTSVPWEQLHMASWTGDNLLLVFCDGKEVRVNMYPEASAPEAAAKIRQFVKTNAVITSVTRAPSRMDCAVLSLTYDPDRVTSDDFLRPGHVLWERAYKIYIESILSKEESGDGSNLTEENLSLLGWMQPWMQIAERETYDVSLQTATSTGALDEQRESSVTSEHAVQSVSRGNPSVENWILDVEEGSVDGSKSGSSSVAGDGQSATRTGDGGSKERDRSGSVGA